MNKKQNRLRRARRTRAKISQLEVPRLTVHRTSQHIYAQVIAPDGCTVLATAATTQADLRKALKGTSNIAAAQAVGKAIADKAKSAGIEQVAFDRSGFRYHGRIKALADAAREQGLRI